MKMLLLMTALFTTTAPAYAANFTGSSYTKSFRFEHPLGTYDRCGADNESGFEAQEGAENEAMLACQQDYNSDCVVIGRRFRTIMSREFIGYKACEAVVTVHGYRMSDGRDSTNKILPPDSDR